MKGEKKMGTARVDRDQPDLQLPGEPGMGHTGILAKLFDNISTSILMAKIGTIWGDRDTPMAGIPGI